MKEIKKALAALAFLSMLLGSGFAAKAQTYGGNNSSSGSNQANPPDQSQSQNQSNLGQSSNTFNVQSVTGTITSIRNNTLTLRNNNQNITVTLASDLKTLDSNGSTINFSDLKNGDNVTAWGIITARDNNGNTTSITAGVITRA